MSSSAATWQLICDFAHHRRQGLPFLKALDLALTCRRVRVINAPTPRPPMRVVK